LFLQVFARDGRISPPSPIRDYDIARRVSAARRRGRGLLPFIHLNNTGKQARGQRLPARIRPHGRRRLAAWPLRAVNFMSLEGSMFSLARVISPGAAGDGPRACTAQLAGWSLYAHHGRRARFVTPHGRQALRIIFRRHLPSIAVRTIPSGWPLGVAPIPGIIPDAAASPPPAFSKQ